MEFKARYELIGAFTLAVIALLFGFVYWLNNIGGLGEQRLYKLQFDTPVAGLQVGGGVFYNGIRVGEVRALHYDPAHSARLNVAISIKADIPVRQDTQVRLDYQGLTGIASIALSGGSPDLPRLAATGGEPPLLIAGSRAGNSWTQSASLVMGEFYEILSENKKPLNEILTNIASFSQTLSGNKERLENILNGLERMTGGSGKPADKVIYDLLPPTGFTPPASAPTWRLVINDPTVLLALNTDKIQQRPAKGQTMPIGMARWSDNLPNLFQEKIIQSYENAGYASSVLRPIEGEDSDNKLLVNIRGFHIALKDTPEGTPTAYVEFTAKLMNGEGKVIASRSIRSGVPAPGVDGTQAANALGKAFSQCAIELIEWSAKLL